MAVTKPPNFIPKMNLKCPFCRELLVQHYNLFFDAYLDSFQCRFDFGNACKMSFNNSVLSLDQLKKLEVEGIELKEIKYTPLFNHTIVRFKFTTIARRGWFVDNVQPMLFLVKGMVPGTERTYNPATFEWELSGQYWAPLSLTFKSLGWTLKLVSEFEAVNVKIPGVEVPKDYAESFHYDNAVVIAKESAESIHSQIVVILGVNFTKSEYRAYARLNHPDLGGDANKMAELNRLWSLYNAVSNDVVNV